jgi:hypothetical protein
MTTAPQNKELKLTKPSPNGASQLNSVLAELSWCDEARLARSV